MPEIRVVGPKNVSHHPWLSSTPASALYRLLRDLKAWGADICAGGSLINYLNSGEQFGESLLYTVSSFYAELELGVPWDAGFEFKIGDHFVDTTDMITVWWVTKQKIITLLFSRQVMIQRHDAGLFRPSHWFQQLVHPNGWVPLPSQEIFQVLLSSWDLRCFRR